MFDTGADEECVGQQYQRFFRTYPKAERGERHEELLGYIVAQMIEDGTHDATFIRALVTQAVNPRWNFQPLPDAKVRELKAKRAERDAEEANRKPPRRR